MTNFPNLLSAPLTVSAIIGDEKSLAGLTSDGNGKYTASDARLVLRHAAKLELLSEEQQKYADVDANGRITAADARLVLRVAAKIDALL